MRHLRLILLALALLAQSAFAWNDLGHKSVALIAWDDLKPEVKTKIAALLLRHPQYATNIQTAGTKEADIPSLDFLTAATWPDLVRSGKNRDNVQYHHALWHYTDIPFITGTLPEGKKPEALGTEYKPGTDPDNILPAMQKCVADLQDPKSTDAQKAVALCWIEHLVGDIHQPLHATSWFSTEFPDGDKGGNSCIINSPAGTMNLHAYWDGILGKYESLEITRHIADGIEKDHPRSEFEKQLKVTALKHWAQESFELCKTTVYLDGKLPHITKDAQTANKMMPVPALPDNYAVDAKALAEKQVALAGYRLADQLNALFADK